MSQTQPRGDASASAETPYPRYNYFESEEEEYDPDREPDDPSTHRHEDNADVGTSKNEWMAKSVLRDETRHLDPVQLYHEPDRGLEPLFAWLFDDEIIAHDPKAMHHEQRAVELSDPEHYPPTGEGSQLVRAKMERKAPSTKRWRVNEETGTLAFGGVLEDVTLQELYEIADELLTASDYYVSEKLRAKLLNVVVTMKRSGKHGDIRILAEMFAVLEGEKDPDALL